MGKQSKQPKRTNSNPYAYGFSPTKVMKLDEETGGPKKYPHVYRLSAVRGGYYEIVWLDHGRNANDDGYNPYILALARGNGSFVDRNNVVHLNSTLVDMGILDYFIRRGNNGEALRNETASNGTYWNRRVLLRFIASTESGPERTVADMRADLNTLCVLTPALNREVDPNSRITNSYVSSEPVFPTNPGDEELMSLDHYLLDEDVVRVMEAHNQALSPTFAADHPEAASVYFNPFRTTYPNSAHKYGFSNRSPGGSVVGSIEGSPRNEQHRDD